MIRIRRIATIIIVGVLLVGVLLVAAPTPAPVHAPAPAPTIPCVHSDGHQHYVARIDEPA